MPATYCNHNAFIDEERFLPGAERRYRAIYNAALAPFKRHALAREVEGLVLITYPLDAPPNYAAETHQTLKLATWLNFVPPDRFTWLSEQEVRECVAASFVGLCLSREEGAMYASMEYLLCGVPIVTTPSIGGRHLFFDEEHVIVVDPEPHAVAMGVEEMLKRRLAPHAVRASALRQVQEHRERYDAAIESVAESLGGFVSGKERVRGEFTHRMFRWATAATIKSLVTVL